MQALMLFGTALFVAGNTPHAGDAPTPAAAAPYTLFMGADFALHSGDGYFRVLNVVGSSFVVRKDGKLVHVHPGAVPISIQVKRSLKLMPGSAQLAGFSWERDYMAGTNPEEKAATAYANLLGNAQDDLTEGSRMQAQGWAAQPPASNGILSNMPSPSTLTPGTPGLSAGIGGGPPLISGPAGELLLEQRSSAAIGQSEQTLSEDTFSANAYNHSQQDAAAADLRNAIHIKFNLRSPLALRKPYAMFVALIHAPGHEHQKQQWIGGTEIDSVEPDHPVHVDYFQGGFPPGYRVDKLSVYIYDDGGREVGTNLSNDRVALTRDQAFEYLVIEYLGDHKSSTLPATPAMTKLPADWRAHASEAWFKQTYYVKVDKNGHAQGIFTDPDCRQPANAYLSDMIAGVWFRPALNQGKPVDTVAQVVPQTLVE